jgi:replication-associated recombination protein RarA
MGKYNYLPWTIKYKPSNFDEIKMDEKLKKKFFYMVNCKNIPNLIIYGPSGSGKTSTGKF